MIDLLKLRLKRNASFNITSKQYFHTIIRSFDNYRRKRRAFPKNIPYITRTNLWANYNTDKMNDAGLQM